MAELTHFHASETTAQTDSSGVFVTKLSITSLAANTKYLIVCRALFASTQINTAGQLRVETADDSVIASKSHAIIELNNVVTPGSDEDGWTDYLFVHSFTTDGTPADLNFQVLGFGSVHADQITLLALDLDNIGTEGTDYYENIGSVTGSELGIGSGSATTIASISQATLGQTKSLILGYAKVGVSSLTRSYGVRMQTALDSTTSVVAELFLEAEASNEERLHGFAVVHDPSGASDSGVLVDAYEEHASANHSNEGGYIIALPASLFADFEFAYTAASETVNAAEETIATVGPYTPTINGNHLIFGSANEDGANDGTITKMHMEEGTTETFSDDSAKGQIQRWDPTDQHYFNTFERRSITAQQTYNLRMADDSNGISVKDRWLIVVNLNEPSAGGLTETVTDPVGVTDDTTSAKSITVAITDPVGVTDDTARIHPALRTVTDPVGVIDSTTPAKSVSVAVTDPVGVTDDTTPVKAVTPSVVEAIGVTDDTTPVKTTTVAITETIGVTDDTTPAKAVVEEISEVVGVTDDTTSLLQITVEVTEALGVTDSTSRVAPAIRSVVEGVAVADAVSDTETNRETLTEPIGVTDTPIRIHIAFRSVAEAVGVADDAVAALTITVEISETIGVTDSITPVKTIIKTVIEQVTVYDPGGNFARPDGDLQNPTEWEDLGTIDNDGNLWTSVDEEYPLDDLSYIEYDGDIPQPAFGPEGEVSLSNPTSDDEFTLHLRVRNFGASIGLTAQYVQVYDGSQPVSPLWLINRDGVDRTIWNNMTFTFRNFAILMIDVTNLSIRLKSSHSDWHLLFWEVAQIAVNFHPAMATRQIARTITDSVGVTDEPIPAKSVTVEVTETVGVTDDISDELQIAVTVSDDVGVTDSTARVAPAVRSISESVAVADSVSDDEVNRETLTEPVGVTDLIDQTHAALRAVSDGVGAADLIEPVKTIPIETSEVLGVTDLVSPVKAAAVSIAESVEVTDPTAAAKTIQVSISESVGVTETVVDDLTAGGTNFTRIVTEAVGVTDDTSRVASAVRSVAESVAVADAISDTETNRETLTETLGVIDSTSLSKSIAQSVTEASGVTDSIEAILFIVVVINEDVGSTDDTTRIVGATRLLLEDVGVTTSLGRVIDWTRTLSDNVTITDVVLALDQSASNLIPYSTAILSEPIDDVVSKIPSDVIGAEF